MMRCRCGHPRGSHAHPDGPCLDAQCEGPKPRCIGFVAAPPTRTEVEDRIAALLDDMDERTVALLFRQLRLLGWSDDRARLVLTKGGWWLG